MEKTATHKVLHRFDLRIVDQVHDVRAQSMPPVIVRELVQRSRVDRPALPHGVSLYRGEMHRILAGYLHAQILHDSVIGLAHRRVVLKRLRCSLPRGVIVVQNHDVVMDMTALGIGMSGDKVRAIRSHPLRQLHAGAVYPGYVRLIVATELLWRKALRDKKRFIFPSRGSTVHPVQPFRAPGLRRGCHIEREIRHVCRTLVLFPCVLAPAIGGINHRTHSVRRPRYLHHAH